MSRFTGATKHHPINPDTTPYNNALTKQLNHLRADLETLTEQQQTTDKSTTKRRHANGRHQFDQNGDHIYTGDTVLFQPPGTPSGSTVRTRGITIRFTAHRVYICHETDRRRRPQEILRDPAASPKPTKFYQTAPNMSSPPPPTGTSSDE